MTPPEEIALDFDATDDAIHGNQVGRFFHGSYNHYCFLPWYVFCGEQLVCAYLRPSNIDGAKHTRAITKLLVNYLHRFIVTNLAGPAAAIYDELYVQRGDMENRIKEQQLMLFADRTSCHEFEANQFRLLLSSLAYVLVQQLRQHHLAGTDLAKAQVDTIRLRRFKVAARVVVSVTLLDNLVPAVINPYGIRINRSTT